MKETIGGVGLAIVQAGTHAVSQGILGLMQGENFGSASLSGFLGSLGASGFGVIAGDWAGTAGGKMFFGALSGGIGAELSGGNFWQGATISAIVIGLNHLAHMEKSPKTKKVNVKISIGQPSNMESLIPILGSGRSAIDHFQNGNYLEGIGYTALAVGDVFLVKSVFTGFGRGMFKLGSYSWNAMRKWMLNKGYVKAGQPLHHSFISQSTAKKYGIEWLSNQFGT